MAAYLDVLNPRPPPRQHFPFFELPRELRDLIYDNLETLHLANEAVREGETGYLDSPVTLEAITPHSLLISRRFKEEAEAQVYRSRTLSFEDHYESYVLKELAPSVFHTISHFHIRMVAPCNDVFYAFDGGCGQQGSECDAFEPVHNYTKWLEKLSKKTTGLRSLTLEIYLSWPDGDESQWPESPHLFTPGHDLNRVIALPHLKDLKFRKYRYEEDEVPFGEQHELYVSWDPKHGWHVPDPEVEENSHDSEDDDSKKCECEEDKVLEDEASDRKQGDD